VETAKRQIVFPIAEEEQPTSEYIKSWNSLPTPKSGEIWHFAPHPQASARSPSLGGGERFLNRR